MAGVWRLGSFGGHLGGPTVSALVDGQLDHESTERAWAHVVGCASCRRAVEREGWVKRQLAQMAGTATPGEELPAGLLGSLYQLEPADREAREAWAAVGELEAHGRGRRRAGIAAVGVGSVSAAVLGFTALSGSPLGIGGGVPSGPPTSALSRSTPTAGPLASLGSAVERDKRSRSGRSGAAAPSTFVPFSGWSFTAPTEIHASVAATSGRR
jgi:hypothetical protein